jgi:cytidine deaminase
MTRAPSAAEAELFDAARTLLEARHHPEIHQVAAAARAADGNVYLGLHLGSRRINVCAESSAIANAEMAGAGPIVAMVAVCANDDGQIIVTNPCGVCRELLQTYESDAQVMVDAQGTVGMVPASSLLPLPWMFPGENTWTPNDPMTGR